MTVHVATPPPLDAEAVPAPILACPKSPQDWEQLVTPGHVLRERLKKGATRRLVLASGAAVTAFVLAVVGPSILNFRIPAEWYVGLQVNPATYTTLPGGESLPYSAHFLADLPTQAGMSGADFVALREAVALDLGQHGPDPTKWTETAKLAKPPRVTRPAKVFEPDKLDALSSGVVSIAQGSGEAQQDAISGVSRRSPIVVDVWGFVDGRLSWSALLVNFGLTGGDLECRPMIGFNEKSLGPLTCISLGNPDIRAKVINDRIKAFNPAPPPAAEAKE